MWSCLLKATLKGHDLIDRIERDFWVNDRMQVTIHYDPIVTSDAQVGALRARLAEYVRQLDARISPARSAHRPRGYPYQRIV